MRTKQEKLIRHLNRYRNPEARKLHEDRAFRLKVRSDKRLPSVEEVTVQKATILMEEDNDEN